MSRIEDIADQEREALKDEALRELDALILQIELKDLVLKYRTTFDLAKNHVEDDLSQGVLKADSIKMQRLYEELKLLLNN